MDTFTEETEGSGVQVLGVVRWAEESFWKLASPPPPDESCQGREGGQLKSLETMSSKQPLGKL